MRGLLALSVLACHGTTTKVNAEVVLSEKIMALAKTSAELSAEVYNPEPNCTDCSTLTNYVDEPDQALFAEKDGYCYGVFRGTTLTFVDWNQNFDPRSEPVCTSMDSSVCCNTRQGFYDAYHASYYEQIEKSLNECAKKCSNPNECVVLAGHSQGGAVAALAAVRMAHLNPFVMTFGEPPTIDYPCQPVTSTRWYRFVNTKDTTIGTVGVTYDVSTLHCCGFYERIYWPNHQQVTVAHFYRHVSMCVYLSSTARSLCTGDGHRTIRSLHHAGWRCYRNGVHRTRL